MAVSRSPAPPDRPAASVDVIEAATAVVVAAVAAVSFTGLALAEAGQFTRLTLAGGSVVALLVVLGAGLALARHEGLRVRRTPIGHWLLLALVVAAGVFAFRPPADAEIDAGDASVYVATGRLIAAEGTLRPPVSAVDGIRAETVAGLLARDRLPPPLHNLFPGGIQLSEDGRVEPGFFHLAAVWVAIWTVWFGNGPLWLTPIAGWLAIGLVWCVARRLWSAGTAAIVTCMLVANFAQIWFARLPFSEGMAEMLVAAAVAALTVAIAESSITAAVLAGLAAGLAGFSRADVLILVSAPLVLLAIAMMVARVGPARPMRWFLAASLCASAYAALHAAIFAWAYVERLYTMLFEFDWSGSRQMRAIVPVAAIALVALVVAAYVRGRRQKARAAVAPVAGAAGVPVVPSVVPVVVVAVASVVAVVVLWRLSNPFVMLLTPAASLLAAVGLAVALTKDRLPRSLPVVCLFLASALVYVPGPLDKTGIPMMLRRYLPVLLPMACVLAGGAFHAGRRWPVLRLAALPVAGLAMFSMWGNSRVLFSARPYAAVHDQVARIADAIPSNALVFVDRLTPSHFALALQSAFGRASLIATASDPAASARAAVDQARAAARPIRIVVAPENVAAHEWAPEAFATLALRPVGLFPFAYTTLTSSTGWLPVAPTSISRSIAVYDAVERGPDRAPLPQQIDVGPLDLAWWPSGVHGPETMQGATARWTNGDARFILPPLDVDRSRPVAIRLRLAAERPDGFQRPSVVVAIGGERAGTFVASQPGFGEYEVTLPPAGADRLLAGGELQVLSDTFVPAEHGSAGDTRRLGVAIDWIALHQDR